MSFSPGTTVYIPGNALAGNYYRLFHYTPGTTVVSGSNNVAFRGLLARQVQQYSSLVADPTAGYLDLGVTSLAATTAAWNLTGGGSWAAAGNWNPAVVPSVQGDVANLGNILTTAGTITLDSQPQVGTLTCSPTGATAYTINAGANSGALTLYNTGSVAFINNQANLNTIAAPITLASPTTNVTVSAGTLARSGVIGGTGGLAVQSGGGPLVLTANATYTGPTSIASGGALQLGNVTTAPTLATPSIADSGILLFNTGANNDTLAGSITGTGAVVLLGNNGGAPVDFTLTSGSNTYSGGTTITGGRLHVTAAGQWGTGPVTVNSTGQFYLAAAVTATNNFTISGPGATEAAGILGAIRLQGGNISGNVVLASSATISVYGGNGTIYGLISGGGSCPLTVGGSALANTLTLANAGNTYSGGTIINLMGSAATAVSLVSANPGALGSGPVTLAAGPLLGLNADGDGWGTPNVAGAYTNTLNFSGTSASLSVGRGGFGVPYMSNLYTQAGVAPAPQAGLTLSGSVSGPGFVKTGAGVLNMIYSMSSGSNSLTSPITVSQGLLAVNADADLGGQAVILGYNGATTGLRFLASGTTNADLRFNTGTGANFVSLETAQGTTLTVNQPFDLSLTSTASLVHDDAPGNLIFNAGNPAWTGTFQNNGGIVQVNSASYATALGAPAGPNAVASNNPGGAFQFLPGQTIAKPFTVNNIGVNNGGALEAVSAALPGGPAWNGTGPTTLSGSISLTSATWLGADAGTVLNFTGGISGAQALTLATGGTINISNNPLGAVSSLTTYFQGTPAAAGQPITAGVVNLTTSSTAFVGAMTIASGAFNISGTGQVGGNGGITVYSGANLGIVDNSPTSIANRLGGNRSLTLSGGTLSYTANGTAASAETFAAFTFNTGASTILLTNTGNANLTLSMTGAINQAAGGSSLDIDTVGATLGTAQAKLVFTNTAALTPANVGIIPRVTVNGANFATYNANGIVAFSAYNGNNNIDTAATTDTMNLSVSPTWAMNYTKTVNALLINGGATLNAPAAGATLAPTTGNILATGGSATIGNGAVVYFTNNLENAFLVNTGSTLNLQGPVSSNYNLTKGLGGTLIFSAPVYDTSAGNWVCLNAGTIQLNAGNQTILPGLNMSIGNGATLDLDGNAQTVASLFSAANAGLLGTGGNVVSSSGTGTLVVNGANNSVFPGQILGNVNLAKAGGNTLTLMNSSNYTGVTLINGGAVTLQDAGVLANTSTVSVNYATLNITDNGLAGISNRLGAAPVILNGGLVSYTGRAQAASVENLGPLTLAQGVSNLAVANAGTGVNSADLVFNSFNLAANPAATVNINASYGQAGNNARLEFNTPPQVTNNIVSAQVIEAGGDFVTYIPGLGLAPLTAVGAPGYDGAVLPTASQPLQNIKLAASGTVANLGGNPASPYTLNSLNLQGSSLTFANSADTLNVVSGGIIKTAALSIGSICIATA